MIGNQKLAIKLIQAGALSYHDANSVQKDLSPIFLACHYEFTDLLEIMCDYGANLNLLNSKGQTPLVFGCQHEKFEIVNYLSLRSKDLNQEDFNHITILMHLLYAENFTMASRLIVRGANINYVNSNGITALHLFVDNENHSAIKYLLWKGAEPHMMDLTGEDCCDKAKRLGIDKEYKEFQECQFRKKIIPMLPNGLHPQFNKLPFFKN